MSIWNISHVMKVILQLRCCEWLRHDVLSQTHPSFTIGLNHNYNHKNKLLIRYII